MEPHESLAMLEDKAKELRNRLHERPNDQYSTMTLSMTLYKLHQYTTALQLGIKSLKMLPDNAVGPGALYLVIGRCHMRAWLAAGQVDNAEAQKAMRAYVEALKDHDILREIVPYYELASINLKLHRYQVHFTSR